MKWTNKHTSSLAILLSCFFFVSSTRIADAKLVIEEGATIWSYATASGNDWFSNSTSGILDEGIVNVSYNNSYYLSPQIVIQVTLGPTNETGNSTTLQYPLHVVLSVQYWEEYTREVASWDIYKIGTPQIFSLDPTASNLTGINMTFFLTGVPTTNTTYYNIQNFELDILKTELSLGKTSNFNFARCPGQRYIQANIDYGIFAFNMTFKAGASTFAEYFTDLWLNFNTLENITKSNAKYTVPATKVISDYYLIENVQQNGAWWFSLQCATPTISSWSFTVKSVETCLLECFEHGTCVDTPAYCLCDTFWDGANCQDTFKGVYTLIGLAIVVGLGFPSYAIYKIWECVKDRDVDTEVLDDDEVEEFRSPAVNSINQDTHVWHRTNGHIHDYDEVEANPLLFTQLQD